ncbi:unnamed protein product [Arabis nemorensis]|uniref:Uncharacterized protein n=1 Tax=Arabis nemorensis TaxID=586526 RepID=A0A565BIQ1_9BRAS|nr:unnamed protein product [Arabis nemorensis]
MDSQDNRNPQHSPGGGKIHGAHVCTKCGWNYPNPHPSAKNRRAHKKVCGTIKGFEIFDSETAKQILDLQEEHCMDDEQKTPSPRIVVEKADERIGDISEEDVFADAVCEFSRSDSFKEKEETATNCVAMSTKNPDIEVVQESCEVSPVEVLENHDVPSSVEAASENRQGGESSTEGHSIASKTLIESSQEAQVIGGGDTVSTVGLKTESKGILPDESEYKLASASAKRADTSDSSWNDDVIYSDLEGPLGFSLEATSMIHPGEADCIVSESVPVDTSLVKANAAQVISTTQSVPDNIPLAENADLSLHGIESLEKVETNHSVNPCLPETPKGEVIETETFSQADNLGIQPKSLSNGTEVPSSDNLLLEDKTEPQGQAALVAVKEFPSAENTLISKTDPEDIEMKAGEGESSFGAAQETVESETLSVSLPAVDPIIADSNADVNRAADKTGVVDLIGHESELIQANDVADDGNSPNSKLNSESSCAAENYVSPVSVVFEGDDASEQGKSSIETSKDSVLQISAEACESSDEARRESSKEGLVEESSFTNVTSTKDDPISHSGSIGTAPDDTTVQTANQKLPESGRTEFHRVVGGLGVIQGNEIDGHVKTHNLYAEVPVTIESNDHRDFGRLQNLSEAHIRSLVSSPLVTRNNTSNAFESNLGSESGANGGSNKSENASLSVDLSRNQEITMEKMTSWSTVKEQHVPLKNLLSEARSPRLQLQAKDNESNIPRVSSILGQETSPEDGRWPERREVKMGPKTMGEISRRKRTSKEKSSKEGTSKDLTSKASSSKDPTKVALAQSEIEGSITVSEDIEKSDTLPMQPFKDVPPTEQI